MAEKQGQLNGAYYGPSVPPQNTYHRPGRGRGCVGGCGCCIIKLLLKIIVAIVFVVGLAALIFWLIFRPNVIKFHVTDAKLTQFNVTNNSLHYNLALNITIRNPNKKIGVYYDRIEARAYYEDQRFGVATLTPFYQGHKNTSTLAPSFNGQQLVVLGGEELADFNADKAAGVYDIDVKLYLRVRFRLGKLKTFRFKPRIACDLKLPLTTASGSNAAYQRSKCELNF